MDETFLTSDRKLWRAVLEQAYADAEQPACLDAVAGEGAAFEPHERLQARRCLRADSAYERANLGLVCEFADVPLDRVISWARRRYPVAA